MDRAKGMRKGKGSRQKTMVVKDRVKGWVKNKGEDGSVGKTKEGDRRARAGQGAGVKTSVRSRSFPHQLVRSLVMLRGRGYIEGWRASEWGGWGDCKCISYLLTKGNGTRRKE